MSDTLVTIIGIFLAAVLMFVFPLMTVSNTQDNIAQVSVQSLVAEFVNNIATKGKITQDDYNTFISELYATGNTYDVQLEHKKMTTNPNKGADDQIGENLYYSVYNSDIIDSTETGINYNKEYLMKKGDYIIVTVKNTNTTIGSQIKNFLYSIIEKNMHRIVASSSALVVSTGSGVIDNVANGDINGDQNYGEVELATLKVGDYVDYIPTVGTYTVAGGEMGTGYNSNQSFTTDSSLKWRILSINEQTNEIELVSASVTQSLYLKGYDGYNHGVDILNDLCKMLYSNTINGAEARSINVEDINQKTTYDYTSYVSPGGFSYGEIRELSIDETGGMYYPNLYPEKIGFGTDASVVKQRESERKMYGVSEEGVMRYNSITGNTDGSTAGTNLRITHTYYSYIPENYLRSLGDNTAVSGLINIGSNYWLASHDCWSINDTNYKYVDFEIRYVSETGLVGGHGLSSSSNKNDQFQGGVRPVVKLSRELLNSSVGDGSKENPWEMK